MVDRAYDLIVSILCAARFDDGYVLSADEARPLARRCADALAQDRGAKRFDDPSPCPFCGHQDGADR